MSSSTAAASASESTTPSVDTTMSTPTRTATTASASLTGRVVRVHLTCRAELPLGSFLRVTGSSLWAPGSTTVATDDGSAASSGGGTSGGSARGGSNDPRSGGASGGGGNSGSSSSGSSGDASSMLPSAALYTSSVEMVTTPETYPVWTTRRPVCIVVHRHAAKHNRVQHHYYRYLVVSPAEQHHNGVGMGNDADEQAFKVTVSTSNEAMGSTVVLEWEDPHGTLQQPLPHSSNSTTSAGSVVPPAGNTSSMSLASVAHPTSTRADYRNLPYRTLDIDVQAGRVLDVQEDQWNVPDDATFQPYLIRDAIHQENRRKLMQITGDPADAMDTTEGPAAGLGSKPNIHRSGQATPPAFSTNNRIFFVCFHLPVVVVQNQSTGEWQASWSESILAKTEGSLILSTYQAYWLGTVTTHPPLETTEDREIVRKLLEDMKCIPIFLDPALHQSHYYGFCKQVLWPAFHNIDLLDLSTCGWLSDPQSVASDWDQSRLDDWWNSFVKVNEEFSQTLTGLLKAGDIVWIHDYHLALLPQQLTNWETTKFGGKVTRKVFFLHIPFPTSQIFRELECGESILTGMLHADVVGFHAFDHARHFLNAAKRILGLNYESLVGGLIGVNFLGTTVLVSMSNVSIEPRMMDAVLQLPSVKAGRGDLKQKHKGRTIIGGVDIAQQLSGATLKLLAYERLLQDYPSWQPHVVMVERILVPRSRKADEDLTTRELHSLVKRIQDKYGTAVIDYQELVGTSLPMDQRLALWRASDIMMSTPIREGLNHWPMEFIYAHREPEEPGVVITSEFSAVSSILNGALRVNPYDIQATITTIDKALSMDRQEREGRRYRDIGFVSNSPSDKWVKNVLRDLRDATSARNATGGSESNSQISTPYGTPNPSRKVPVDSTAAFLARESNLAFAHLHLSDVRRAYETAKRRVIILDFNGTIVMKEPPGKYLKREILGTSGNKPPPDVIDALGKLCADPKNTVYVVSGDSSENVMNALGHLPGLGLGVSNGACFSPPIDDPSVERRRWLTFDLGVDWDAVKRVALPVLSKYTARSNGSFVKLTSFSIGWSYYSCDPEWGSLQASHLVLELENELRAFDVRFVTLKGIVEILPRKLNKGLIVKNVMRETALRQDAEGEGVDFVLCFGDDISDEKMFTSVFSFMSELGDEVNSDSGPPVFDENRKTEDTMDTEITTVVPNPLYSFTVAVGKKATHASFYVNDSQEVANALVMLAQGEVPAGGVPVWGNTTSSQMFD